MIQLELRLGHVKLIIERILSLSGGLFLLGRQFFDQRFIRFQSSLCLLQTRLDLLCFGAQYWRMLLCVSHCGCKRQVHLFIRESQSFLREGKFLGAGWHLRQPLGRQQWTLIH